MVRNEGIASVFRGATGQAAQQIIRAGSFFPLYNGITPYVTKHVTDNKIASPLITSTIARIISVSMTFGIEKWTTQLQATKLQTKLDKNVAMTTGFVSIANRDIIFSAIMWTCMENIRRSLKDKQLVESEVGLTIAASTISGAFAAFCTYPFDLIKTLRIAEYEKFKGVNSFTMINEIYKERGFNALTSGLNARIIRLVFGTFIFFGALETQLQHILKNKL